MRMHRHPLQLVFSVLIRLEGNILVKVGYKMGPIFDSNVLVHLELPKSSGVAGTVLAAAPILARKS